MKVNDQVKGNSPKRYELYDEVDEVDRSGVPTGKKIKVWRFPDHFSYEVREAWLESRLTELETQEIDELDATGSSTGRKLKAAKVTVVRGSADDVIGIQIDYEVAP